MQHADIALCKIKNYLQSAVGLIVLIMAYHGSEDRSFLKRGSLLHQTPPPPCFWSVFFFSFFTDRNWERGRRKSSVNGRQEKEKTQSLPLSLSIYVSLAHSLPLSKVLSVSLWWGGVCVCVCVHARAWVGECVVGGGGGWNWTDSRAAADATASRKLFQFQSTTVVHFSQQLFGKDPNRFFYFLFFKSVILFLNKTDNHCW